MPVGGWRHATFLLDAWVVTRHVVAAGMTTVKMEPMKSLPEAMKSLPEVFFGPGLRGNSEPRPGLRGKFFRGEKFRKR